MSRLPSLIGDGDLDALAHICELAPLGNVVEVGVYKGGSAQRLYEVCQRQGRKLFLYDTFTGHPIVDNDRDVPDKHWLGRFNDAINPAELQRLLPEAIITQGTFPDSMRHDMHPIAFVHSDVDLYWPTEAVCRLLPPLMVNGGLIVFDDYDYPECAGVKHAVDAAFNARVMRYKGRAGVCVRTA